MMTREQREVLEEYLAADKTQREVIKQAYAVALADIKAQTQALMNKLPTSSVLYQLQYKKTMAEQIEGILTLLESQLVSDTTDYLAGVYDNGFYGSAYSMAAQGVPVAFGVDQKQLAAAINVKIDDYKFSDRIRDNVDNLKRATKTEITRGIANGSTYAEIARNIALHTDESIRRAQTITRTEAHRVQNTAREDAMHEAKKRGADIVKMWDSTLDGKTRRTHRKLDGQIRELDEPFEVDGHKAMRPGGFGRPEEDINCRCQVLERARWALQGKRRKLDNEHQFNDDGTLNYISTDGKRYKEWKEELEKAVAGNGKKVAQTGFKTKIADYRAEHNGLVDELNTLQKEKKAVAAKVFSLEEERRKTKLDIDYVQHTEPKMHGAFDYADPSFNLDDAIKQRDALQKEYEDVSALVSRYYDRPKRGTPERAEWDEWKKSVDTDALIEKQMRMAEEIANYDADIRNYPRYKKWVEETERIPEKRKRLAELDAEIANAKKREKEIDGGIAEQGAKIEKVLHNAGKEVQDRLQGNDAVKQHRQQIATARDELAAERKTLDELYAAYQKNPKDSDAINRYNEQYHVWKQKRDAYDAARSGNQTAKALKDTLAEVREMGAQGVDVKAHLGNSRSAVAPSVMEAYEFYPSDWVKQSADMGKLAVKKVDRGYYSHHDSTIAISGGTRESQFTTAVHELGHRFERSNPNIRVAEKAFYDRRTAGEELKWMGAGYRRDEITRRDNFLNPYIGKDYNGEAYEVVSMGFQYAYTDPEMLEKDADFAALIYGILAIQ